MPITRAMDPERAHKMSVFLASRGFVPRTKDKDPEILVRSIILIIGNILAQYFCKHVVCTDNRSLCSAKDPNLIL